MRKLSEVKGDRAGQSRSEVSTRALSGVTLGALALAATWAGGWSFAAFWLAAAVVVATEWIAMSRAEPRRILTITAAAGCAAALVAQRTAGGAVAAGTLVAAAIGLCLIARDGRSRSWALGGLACSAVLVLVPVAVRDRADLAVLAILWMFAVVWTTDIAAFFAGRALGGPKLSPRISPKKTWSGFLGGLIGATIAGVAVVAVGQRYGAPVPGGLPAVAAASALASVSSQLGDLAESAMKRTFAVKDSGRLIPGHGGVMDRLDGFAAVALLFGLALAGARLVER